MSHYDWLEENFPAFLQSVGGDFNTCGGIIVAHGDKCYGYRSIWEKEGIPFEHGVALYLLSYLNPWAKEVRETATGWVPPFEWVMKVYPEMKSLLPPV